MKRNVGHTARTFLYAVRLYAFIRFIYTPVPAHWRQEPSWIHPFYTTFPLNTLSSRADEAAEGWPWSEAFPRAWSSALQEALELSQRSRTGNPQGIRASSALLAPRGIFKVGNST